MDTSNTYIHDQTKMTVSNCSHGPELPSQWNDVAM